MLGVGVFSRIVINRKIDGDLNGSAQPICNELARADGRKKKNTCKDKHSGKKTCVDSFTFGSFGPVRYALYQHIIEFLQW